MPINKHAVVIKKNGSFRYIWLTDKRNWSIISMTRQRRQMITGTYDNDNSWIQEEAESFSKTTSAGVWMGV